MIDEVLSGARRWHVEQGDCLAVLRAMPDACVQCCVTSPPYYGLRDYRTGKWDGGDPACDHLMPPQGGTVKSGLADVKGKQDDQGYTLSKTQPNRVQYRDVCRTCGAVRVDRQIGLEDTPDAFVSRLVEVFREVRRVLRPDGVAWVNMGDAYAGGGIGGGSKGGSLEGSSNRERQEGSSNRERQGDGRLTVKPFGYKPKDLLGVPWMLAFALRADGWYLRSEIIWHKPAPMPESVTDRPTKAHEQIFLLTKQGKYFYDADAVSEPANSFGRQHTSGVQPPKVLALKDNGYHAKGRLLSINYERSARNLRSVWTFGPSHFSEAHFATFPPELPSRCIKAGTSERGCCPSCGAPWKRVTERDRLKRDRPNEYVKRSGEVGTGNSCSNAVAGVSVRTVGWEPTCDCPEAEPVPCVVLDPFSGAGTTVMVARRLGRRGLGIELNPEYVAMSRRRIAADNPLFNAEAPCHAE